MHSFHFFRTLRPALGLVLCLCLAAFLAGAFGCGKKSLDPSRYGGAQTAPPSAESEVWSPPPQPAPQALERDIETPAQPSGVIPDYDMPAESTVPVFRDAYQLASFSTREYAQRFSRRAQDAGFSTTLEDAVVGGQSYYRVIGTIEGTEDEIRRAVRSLGVNPVQRSHDPVTAQRSTLSGAQASMRTGMEPEAAIDALAAELSASGEPFAAEGESGFPFMSSGDPALPEPEKPMGAPMEPQYDAPEPQTELFQDQSRAMEQPEQADPMLGPSYRAPMQQPAAAAGTETAAVSPRTVSQPQAKPASTPRQSIIPPSAPPTFIGSPTCQEKNGRLIASALGRSEDPLRAERIAVDQAKRSLLLCVQAYREEAGLASGTRLTALPLNYLEISDPQRRPDGAVFVSVGIAVEDIPKLTADR
ncbi:SPOR domain-containing protein [Oceanidesulfovibrio indonesiensis]|nr:SPOR domain-containing protein [Oceanidesulfovibrio indonesiensis]